VADARLEAVLAQVLLEHPDDRSALLVGEDVEHALGVGGRHDLELDGAGVGERVGLERLERLREAERRPDLPVGTERVGAASP
jgi:hypothetical protein